MMTVYLLLAGLCAAWLAGWLIFFRLPTIPTRKETAASKDLTERGELSIIISARNEAENLPQLLASLQQQTLHPVEILVVDDGSEDETIACAKGFGATVLQTAADSAGKAAACWLGASQAVGKYLLFLDADTFFLAEDGLERLFAAYEERSGQGLLSVQPYHQTKRLYEQLSAVFNVVLPVGLNRFSIVGEKLSAGGAFGPCILCSKTAYLQANGHQDMPQGILDDLALARRFKKKRLPIALYGGKDLVAFRMYPAGVRQLVQGWTKDFATASQSTHPLIMAGVILWISGGIGVLAAPFLMEPLWLGLLFYAAYFGQTLCFARRVGNFNRILLLFFPCYFLFFLGLFGWSWIQTHLLKSVTWKGRKINL
ncbi:glycosyltransferase [Enterococcus casseliflavus]|uniref:glycosyltransferase n=1 Tax=Enterococcus casseliflavus TaxID=37734 RepID=UPI0039A4C280